jgi:hypothetical protein
MNEQHSPTPPQVEGIITKPSSFSAKSLVERLQETLQSRGLAHRLTKRGGEPKNLP